MSNTKNNQEKSSTFSTLIKIAVGFYLMFIGGQALFAQDYNQSEPLSKKSLAEVTNYYKDGKLDRQMIGISFRETKYRHIIRMGHIFVSNQEELDTLLQEAETALSLIGKNVAWSGKSIRIYQDKRLSKIVGLTDYSGKKYGSIPLKYFLKLLKDLKAFKFTA
jgi:hypothetical protein|tara:strand:+ start:139 stop:627 length:489 start_codon:yes stop_codon:yes gene_type:complete